MAKTFLSLIVVLISSIYIKAQSQWEPTPSWPFAYKNFRPATVYSGTIKKTKTIIPSNIHLGNHTLWYSQNDTLMEALKNQIIKVEFSNGDVYVPTFEGNLGLLLREDTINSRIARLIQVWTPDQNKIDDEARARLHMRGLALGGGAFSGLANSTAEALEGNFSEENPMPMTNHFYMYINGEMFEAKESQILKHLPKEKRQAYLNFTRSAEIISTSPKSMMKVWDSFISPSAK